MRRLHSSAPCPNVRGSQARQATSARGTSTATPPASLHGSELWGPVPSPKPMKAPRRTQTARVARSDAATARANLRCQLVATATLPGWPGPSSSQMRTKPGAVGAGSTKTPSSPVTGTPDGVTSATRTSDTGASVADTCRDGSVSSTCTRPFLTWSPPHLLDRTGWRSPPWYLAWTPLLDV
jgi:hypothetical protein